MSKQKSSQPIHLGLGTASIISVFVVLCLAALAVLSLTGARTALNLSQQHAKEAQSYYEADAQAQRYLAGLVEGNQDGAYTQDFPFGNGMTLQLEATLDAGQLSVTRYSVQAPEAETDEDFLELWDE